MTSTADSNVYYTALPSFEDLARSGGEHHASDVHVLIDGEAASCNTSSSSDCNADSDLGLRTPAGVAVHQRSSGATLFVSDVEAGNIYAYSLWGSDGVLHVGRQRRVAESVGSSGLRLAVDNYGVLYFTGNQDNHVSKIDTSSGNSANFTEVVYDSGATDVVSTPGGVAVDNFFVYWGNEANGNSVGAVGKGLERPEEVSAFAAGENSSAGTDSNQTATTYPTALTSNTATVNGVCLARDNLFYTAADSKLYAVKAGGGSVTEVYTFSSPQGCKYDSEGTLYVADSTDNAIYAMPANFLTLRSLSSVSKVANVTAPSQLAIFTVGTRGLFDHEPSGTVRSFCAFLSVLMAVAMHTLLLPMP